jgi:hypothetical protein
LKFELHRFLKLTDMFGFLGTAMHHTTRKVLGVHGLAPSRIESLEIQKRRAMVQLRSKQSMIEKYIFMAQMRNTNIPRMTCQIFSSSPHFCKLTFRLCLFPNRNSLQSSTPLLLGMLVLNGPTSTHSLPHQEPRMVSISPKPICLTSRS